MSYEPIIIAVMPDGKDSFIADLPRCASIYRMIIVTYDTNISQFMAYEPSGSIIASGDVASILKLAQNQHYEMIVYTWPDLYVALKHLRNGSLS